jgi:iron complex outermembrane receptor protein
MRLKSVILASTSFFILAGAAPAFAQTDSTAAAQDAAAGAQDATAAGASVQQGEEDAIVVTGLRRSLESSQRIKRESEGIVDAIVAEDIGKLPDTFRLLRAPARSRRERHSRRRRIGRRDGARPARPDHHL